MDEIVSYLKNKKNLINLLILGIMILGLPVGIKLAKEQKIFFSRARQASVEFLPLERNGNNCVINKNGTLVAVCKNVVVKIVAGDVVLASNRGNDGLIKKAYAADASCDTAIVQGCCDNGSTFNGGDAGDDNNWTKTGCATVKEEYLECGSFAREPNILYKVLKLSNGVYEDGGIVENCLAAGKVCYQNNRCEQVDFGCSGCNKHKYKNLGDGSFYETEDATCSEGCDNAGGSQSNEFSCGDGTHKVDNLDPTGKGKYLASDQVVNEELKPWKDGNGLCGYQYLHWVKGGDPGPYCVNDKNDFGQWDNQDQCKDTARAQQGILTSSGQDCAAKVYNGEKWITEIKEGINQGDTLKVAALDQNNNLISDAKLSMKVPGTDKADTPPVDSYYRFEKPGDYVLTADGGVCASKPKATIKVKADDSSGSNQCYACGNDSKWRTGTCADNPKTCKSNDPSTFDGCRGGDAKVGVYCGSGSNPSPASGPSGKIVGYKLSETPTGFKEEVAFTPYTEGGVTTEFEFSDQNPGKKFVFVQFKDDKGKVSSRGSLASASIDMIGPRPGIETPLACSYNIKTDVLDIKIRGSNFGSPQGTVSINGQSISPDKIDGWGDQEVKVHINRPQSASDGTSLRIKVTKADGQADESSCGINVTQFDVGAKWMCGAVPARDIPNVNLTVYDMNTRQKTSETVTISKEGTIKGTKTKLSEGSPYRICIKPLLGVRTCSNQFTFSPGTIVTKLDIPIGDLDSDGCINNKDTSMLKQLWFSAGTSRNADFNSDGKVNTFEWGCMKQKFNMCDTSEPF